MKEFNLLSMKDIKNMLILDLHVFQFKPTLETAITDTQFVVTTTNYCLFQHQATYTLH